MTCAGLSHWLTESLCASWEPAGHPQSQNCCVAADQSHVVGLGNASAAARPCDDHRTLACRDERRRSAADQNCAARRNGSRPGRECVDQEGTSFQTEAARKVPHDLCWREKNPSDNNHNQPI